MKSETGPSAYSPDQNQMPIVGVVVGEADFFVADLEQTLLSAGGGVGAIAAFTGYVRNANEGDCVAVLELEHYPGMTEKAIEAIVQDACARWSLQAVQVVHRVGKLAIGERIVYVGVASAHRGEAFAACEFIMDYLKTRAPFWKKETTDNTQRWVDARDSDTQAADRWR
jgi:molybdopterin synthase catalytic subunit